MSALVPYVGGGAALFVSDDDGRGRDEERIFGLRIPLGLSWWVPSEPFEIFLEAVPGIGIIESTSGFFQGGIGARYYF